MYTLAFDTTARSCSIALLKDDKLLSTFSEEMDFGQSEVLIPEIKKMLDSNNLPFSEIGLVIVCVGPGSFTGVRSSISAARAFGIADSNLTVMGVSAFEAYCSEFKPDEIADINAVIIETKRDDFYYQLFDNKLNKITEPSAGTKDDIISHLRNKSVSFIGDGVERFLYSPTGLKLHALKTSSHLSVEVLARQGLKKFKNKVIDYPKPLYLRAPDVCVKNA